MLIKFGFVTYNEKDSTEKDVKLIYSLDADKVLTILRYAKWVFHIFVYIVLLFFINMKNKNVKLDFLQVYLFC